jgi:hypothetical protein
MKSFLEKIFQVGNGLFTGRKKSSVVVGQIPAQVIGLTGGGIFESIPRECVP